MWIIMYMFSQVPAVMEFNECPKNLAGGKMIVFILDYHLFCAYCNI